MKGTDWKDKILKFYDKFMLVIGLTGHLIFVLQAYKIFSTGSAASVSLPGLSVACVSLFSWLFYGILKRDTVLIIVNTFGLIASIVCIATVLIYK